MILSVEVGLKLAAFTEYKLVAEFWKSYHVSETQIPYTSEGKEESPGSDANMYSIHL